MEVEKVHGRREELQYVALVVATYWFVSISMVYLNKLLMSSTIITLNAPFFITWIQLWMTALVCWFCGEMGQRHRLISSCNQNHNQHGSTQHWSSMWTQFPQVEYNWEVARKILPLSVVFVAMVATGNLCLKWVEVSFYNIARSLTIVFNVLFSHTILGMPTSQRTMACLAVVILGFWMGSEGEAHFSFAGTSIGVVSSLFGSLNSIYTKKAIQFVRGDDWKLIFYNSVNATLLFLPLIVTVEGGTIWNYATDHVWPKSMIPENQHDDQERPLLFLLLMMFAGFFAFVIGYLTVLQIKATSPLTHTISGNAKAAVQSILALYIWGNPTTWLSLLGISVVLGGSFMYAAVRMEESNCSQTGGGASAVHPQKVRPSTTDTSSSAAESASEPPPKAHQSVKGPSDDQYDQEAATIIPKETSNLHHRSHPLMRHTHVVENLPHSVSGAMRHPHVI